MRLMVCTISMAQAVGMAALMSPGGCVCVAVCVCVWVCVGGGACKQWWGWKLGGQKGPSALCITLCHVLWQQKASCGLNSCTKLTPSEQARRGTHAEEYGRNEWGWVRERWHKPLTANQIAGSQGQGRAHALAASQQRVPVGGGVQSIAVCVSTWLRLLQKK